MLSNLYPLFSQFLLQLRASDPHSGMLATSTKAGGGAEGASTESADDARSFIKLSKMAEVGRKRGAERERRGRFGDKRQDAEEVRDGRREEG